MFEIKEINGIPTIEIENVEELVSATLFLLEKTYINKCDSWIASFNEILFEDGASRPLARIINKYNG